jgi:NitT/TauT family transport system permease protein
VLPAVIALLTLVVLLVAWKVYVEAYDVSRFVLPPPDEVWHATVDLLGEGDTWAQLWVTLQEVLIGFALAVVLGVGAGLVMGEVQLIDRAFTPYLVALQVLPKVAIIPILLVWLGFGMPTRIVVATIFALFPIIAGTRTGVRSVEPGHRDLAAVLQAGRGQRLRWVVLPSAAPAILTGLEVGIVFATIGAVVAEYLSPGEGLGWLAITSLNQLQVDRLFAVIVVLSAMGFVLYVVVASLRLVVTPWHQSTRAPAAR